jgi:hypothetical protein
MRVALLMLLLAWSAAALAPAAATPSSQGDLVIVKEGTKEYHRPGCEVIRDGQGVLAMTRAQAEGRTLRQHPGCDPEAAAPDEPAAAAKPGAKPSPKTTMVVIDGGRHYHKDEKCTRVGKDSKKAPLEEAGRKLWPCPECKPPIRPRQR